MVRKRIRFYGEVQGVGFRYTARHAADYYGCTGWVSNMWDGSVAMEIQGEEEQIYRVIRSLTQGRWIRIEKMDVKNTDRKDGCEEYPPGGEGTWIQGRLNGTAQYVKISDRGL